MVRDPERTRVLPFLRPTECVLISYFTYTALLSLIWGLPLSIRMLALAIPAILTLLAHEESHRGNKATGVLREWIVPALVLTGYWEIGWFRLAHSGQLLEQRWIVWDRVVLDRWQARAAIESLGSLIPWVLELCYGLMYVIPTLSLFLLYRMHLRSRVERYLFTFVLGTLAAYALLPFFPSDAPRYVFPGQDMPGVSTGLRQLNLWLQNRYDIRTSVFPSGHVAAAFSAAFAMLIAVPEKKRLGIGLMAIAAIISVTTVYGRYHYVVDGIAGLSISVLAAGASALVFSAKRRRFLREPAISSISMLQKKRLPHSVSSGKPL